MNEHAVTTQSPLRSQVRILTTIEAPSGLVGNVRKIKGTELIRLAESPDDASPDGGFGLVLNGCWLRTTEPGPYSFIEAGDVKPRWEKLLKGDVLYAFIMLRALSMPDGDNYHFPVQCEECKKRYDWTVRLSELAIRRLPDESAARVRAGKTFETKLSTGQVVKFNLQTISQEEPITRLMKQQKRTTATMIDTLVGQIVAIDGVNPDIKARHKFVSELDMDELYNLRETFDSHDCGVETSFQTRCTARTCRWEQDVNLPLGRTFFAARRRPIPVTEEEKEEEAPDTDNSSGVSLRESTPNGAGGSLTASSGTNTEEAATLSPTETSKR